MAVKITCKGCKRNIKVDGDIEPGDVLDCPICQTCLSIPSNILGVGESIGGCVVERHLGSGAMGCVYLAQQESMGRQVALKVLPPEIKQDPQGLESFMREVKLLAKLSHPNLVTAFEAGEEGGNYYVAMTYVDGETLEDKIKREGKMDEKAALHMGRKIAESLQYAWCQHGILHRDIKPANIMIDQDGEPKLLDMGLSKVHGVDSSHSITGFMAGTPHYMSPEQARNAKDVDFRTDIYALGCTMFEMLTGRVPYEGASVMAVLAKHMNDPVPSPQEANPGISDVGADILKRMMAKDLDDRIQTWEEVVRDLKDAERGRGRKRGGAVSRKSPVPPRSAASKASVSHRPGVPPVKSSNSTVTFLIIIAAILGLVVIGGLIAMVS